MLNTANSAYFGLRHKVKSIGHALMILGLFNVRTMLYQESLRDFSRAGSSARERMASLWEHATLVSLCAPHINSLFPGLDRSTLLTIGLLHDIGKFVLLRLESDGSRPRPEHAGILEEDEIFGINHALIARLAFEEWGFPDLLVKTAEKHHALSRVEMNALGVTEEYLKYLLILFLANHMAKLFAGQDAAATPPLALSYRLLIDRKKLLNLALDTSLFSEIGKTRALVKSYLGHEGKKNFSPPAGCFY